MCVWQARAYVVTPIEEMMRAMLAWGWSVEIDSSRSKSQIKRRVSKIALVRTEYYSHCTARLSVVPVCIEILAQWRIGDYEMLVA